MIDLTYYDGTIEVIADEPSKVCRDRLKNFCLFLMRNLRNR